jgi:hypothetical protein
MPPASSIFIAMDVPDLGRPETIIIGCFFLRLKNRFINTPVALMDFGNILRDKRIISTNWVVG